MTVTRVNFADSAARARAARCGQAMERLGQEPVATGRRNKSATPSHYFRRLRRAATDRRATGAQHSTSRPRRDSDKRQSPWAARTSVRLSAIKPDGPGAQLLAKLAVLVPAHRPPTGPGAAKPLTQMLQPGGPAHGGSAAVTPATPATSGSAALANSDNQAQPAGRQRAPDSDSLGRGTCPRRIGGSHIGHQRLHLPGQIGLSGSVRRPPAGTGAAEQQTRIHRPGGLAHGGPAAVTSATPAIRGSDARANSECQARPAGRPRAPARRSGGLGPCTPSTDSRERCKSIRSRTRRRLPTASTSRRPPAGWRENYITKPGLHNLPKR